MEKINAKADLGEDPRCAMKDIRKCGDIGFIHF